MRTSRISLKISLSIYFKYIYTIFFNKMAIKIGSQRFNSTCPYTRWTGAFGDHGTTILSEKSVLSIQKHFFVWMSTMGATSR